jgi:flagellar motility protein MotE (MotC chaperone)
MCDFLKNNTDESVPSVEKRDIYNESINYNDYTNFEDDDNETFIPDETSYELSEDEKLSENKRKNILPFTKTLKNLRNIKFEKEYKQWLDCNGDLVKSAYYIIQSKYLNDVNINDITLEEFSIFCFLSN